MSCLFPGSPCKPWKKVNLNDEFLLELKKNQYVPNMRSLKDQDALLKKVSYDDECYTYGGYGEDRSDLWDGFEPKMKRMIHLGLDLNNLPVGQAVASISSGAVVHIMNDKTRVNGWGNRIIICYDYGFISKFQPIRYTKSYFLYGHLDESKCPVKLGDKIKQFDIIGYIGEGKSNGGWFPHLHLQIMSEQFLEKFKTYEEIDGYSENVDDLKLLVNPLEFLQI
jgi:hypothetical protein